MSESDEPYTVVDELEEGEIVENACRGTGGTPPRAKKQKLSHSTLVLDSKCNPQPKNKTSPNAKKNAIVVNPKSTCLHKSTISNASNPLAGHAVQPTATHNLRAKRKSTALSKKPDIGPIAHEPTDRFAHKQPVRGRGRVFDIPAKDRGSWELNKDKLSTSSVPQLDLNSSYDDLLKHHREIQKALARLEQEQKKNRKKCPHKSGGRRHSRSDRNEEKKPGKSSTSPVAVRVQNSTPHNKQLPKTGMTTSSPVPKNKPRGKCKFHSQKGKQVVSSAGNKLSASETLTQSREPIVRREEEVELERLRLNALLSVSSKAGAGNASDSAGVNNAGCNKENTVPNSNVSGSAFSVSGCRDDYSVVDMEVDEDDSCNPPEIIVSSSHPPRPPRPPSVDEEEEDIEVMRERLLQSLRKAREPDSTTDIVGDGTGGQGRLVSVVNRGCPRVSTSGYSDSGRANGSDSTPDSSGVVTLPSPLLGSSSAVDSASSFSGPCSSMPAVEPYPVVRRGHRRDGPVAIEVPIPDSPVVCCSSVAAAHGEPSTSSSRVVELNGSGALSPNVEAREESSPVPPPLAAICDDVVEVPVVASTSKSTLPSNPISNGKNACHKPPNAIPKKIGPKIVPHSWTFMKQKPVIINLNDDTTEESDSESSDEGGVPTLNCLEELIRSEKLKASYRQSDKTPGSLEPRAGPSNASEQPGAKPTRPEQPVKIASIAPVQNPSPPPPPGEGEESVAACDHPKDLGVSQDLVREYNLLCKKLTLASDTFKKEQQILSMKKINANKKKSSFINSQLVVQRLKEQLAAAEKVKNTNMRMMFVANAELETVQGSVLKRALLVKQMREQCHRLEEHISSTVPFPLDVILNTQ